MRLYGWELLAICNDLDEFGDNKHCGKRLIIFNLSLDLT